MGLGLGMGMGLELGLGLELELELELDSQPARMGPCVSAGSPASQHGWGELGCSPPIASSHPQACCCASVSPFVIFESILFETQPSLESSQQGSLQQLWHLQQPSLCGAGALRAPFTSPFSTTLVHCQHPPL